MTFIRLIPLDGDYSAAQAVGCTATHTSGGFTIKAFTRSPRFVGAVAQEWRELGRERMRGLMFAVPAAAVALAVLLLIGAPLALAIIGPMVAAFGAYVAFQNDSLALEAWSHATTVRANALYDGMTLEAAETESAKSLQGYDGAAGKTVDDLIAMMRPHYPDADAWLAANADLCRKWQAVKRPSW